LIEAQLKKTPALAYIGPFVLFLGLLAVMPQVALDERAKLVVWLVAPAAAIWALSRGVLEFRPARPVWSVLVGVAVFVLWVGPDQLWPGYRGHWLFQNALLGQVKTSLGAEALRDPVALWLRAARAALVVPVLEELFWRGWLMRWFIEPEFEKVELGRLQWSGFLYTAVLFAMEHGPFWDVGLVAGLVYNGWMVKTGRLSDLILAHAVTNACLCGFVVATGQWGYWL